MATWDELNSDKALLCRREINGEGGGAVVQCVVLADGFILECGAQGPISERRAKTLVDMINSSGPDRLSKKVLHHG